MARAEQPHVAPSRPCAHERDQTLQPLARDLGRHRKLGRQARRRRAVARREDEGVRIREADRLHGAERLLELLLRLAGKADDHVRRERQSGHRGAQPLDAFEILLARVAPQHALQRARGSALHREVHVLADGGHFGERRDDALAEVIRVRAGEPHTPNARHGADASQQVGEVVPPVVVRVHRLAQQHDLAHSFGDDGLGLTHHVLEPPAALRPACGGNDAVGAAIVAATLHGDPCLHAVEPPRREVLVVLLEIERRGNGAFTAPRAVHQRRQRAIAVRPDHERDVSRLLEQRWAEPLRHAARHAHDAVRLHVPLQLT